MVDATQVVGWGGDDNVPCTCTHGRCYATSCFLHLHTWLVLRNIMFLALAHHGLCYGVGLGWGGVGMITFLALAHMVGATQHHVSCMHLHTWSVLRNIMGWGGVGVGWGGDDNVPCTCTHGRCYATSCL